LGRSDADPGIEQHRQHRQLGGGIGMRQAAADGATVAYGQMRDVLHRSGHDGQARLDEGRGLKRVVARESTDPDAVTGLIDVPKTRDAIDVDEERRANQSEVEHRHQALPAGE
jgi:hypothetical protein